MRGGKRGCIVVRPQRLFMLCIGRMMSEWVGREDAGVDTACRRRRRSIIVGREEKKKEEKAENILMQFGVAAD